MTEKQKAFLTELDALMKKYDIDAMRPDKAFVFFVGEDETIGFNCYEDGEFKHITQSVYSYKP